MSRLLGAAMVIGLTSLVYMPQVHSGARERIAGQMEAAEPAKLRASTVQIENGTTTHEMAPLRPRQLAQARAADAPERPSFKAPEPFSNQHPATETRRRLATEIQTELQRVGCYSGRVSGDWDTPTRRAMMAFNDHVNATLPVGEPDYVLLTLVRGHHAKACGAACRRGETMAASGRCEPRSVVAEERRQASRVAQAKDQGSVTGPSAVSAAAGSIAGDSRAEASRDREAARIAAIEARKRLELAEAKARAEADRRARLVEIEKARRSAENRRQEELKALDARRRVAAAPQRPDPPQTPPTAALAVASNVATVPAGATPLSPPASIAGPANPATVSGPSLVAIPKARTATRGANGRANRTRYAGRPVPPPTYRVGRVAPMRLEPPRRTYVRARRNHQMIFRSVQHLAP